MYGPPHSLHVQALLTPDISRMGQPLGAGSNWHGGNAAGGGAGGAAPSPQDVAWAAQFPSMSVASRRALQVGGLNMATAKLLVDERLYKQPDDLRVRGEGGKGMMEGGGEVNRAWRGVGNDTGERRVPVQ